MGTVRLMRRFGLAAAVSVLAASCTNPPIAPTTSSTTTTVALGTIDNASLVRTSSVSAAANGGRNYTFSYSVTNTGPAACIPQLLVVLHRTTPSWLVQDQIASNVCLATNQSYQMTVPVDLSDGHWIYSAQWTNGQGAFYSFQDPSPILSTLDVSLPTINNASLVRTSLVSATANSATNYTFSYSVTNTGPAACIPQLLVVLHRTTPSWLVQDQIASNVCLATNQSYQMTVPVDLSDGHWIYSAQWTNGLGAFYSFQDPSPIESTLDVSSGYGLPWPTGASRYLGSFGLHSFDGLASPQSSLDFIGTGSIVAVAAGTVITYSSCQPGFVIINHGNGLYTGYYHLSSVAVSNGQQVAKGTVLGQAGTTLPCGGSATGSQVHFSIFSTSGPLNPFDNNQEASLVGRNFGGWVVQSNGCLVRSSDGLSRCSNGLIPN